MGAATRARRCPLARGSVSDVVWVQESGPESLETKRAMFAGLDAKAAPDVILASSFQSLWDDPGDAPVLDGALVERLGRETDVMSGAVPRQAIRAWRDRLVAPITRMKHEDAEWHAPQ